MDVQPVGPSDASFSMAMFHFLSLILRVLLTLFGKILKFFFKQTAEDAE